MLAHSRKIYGEFNSHIVSVYCLSFSCAQRKQKQTIKSAAKWPFWAWNTSENNAAKSGARSERALWWESVCEWVCVRERMCTCLSRLWRFFTNIVCWGLPKRKSLLSLPSLFHVVVVVVILKHRRQLLFFFICHFCFVFVSDFRIALDIRFNLSLSFSLSESRRTHAASVTHTHIHTHTETHSHQVDIVSSSSSLLSLARRFHLINCVYKKEMNCHAQQQQQQQQHHHLQ